MLNTITAALETKLKNFAVTNGYDVAYLGVSYTPTDQPYLRCFMLPSQTTTRGLPTSSLNDYRGIFQVDVLQPKGQGIVTARAIVDEVLAEFSKGSKQGDVFVEMSWAGTAFEDRESWAAIPVSIRYRAFL